MKRLNDLFLPLLQSHSRLLAFGSQAVASGGNFLTGILLARWLGLDGYGAFGVIWVGVLLVLGLHQAGVTSPMLTLFPSYAEQDRPAYLARLLCLQKWLTGVGLLVGVFAALAAELLSLPLFFRHHLPPAIAVAALLPAQDLLRKVYFALGDYRRAFFLDSGLYISLLGALAATAFMQSLTLRSSLLLMAGAYASTVMAARFFLPRQVFLTRPTTGELRRLLIEHYHFSKWLLGTALLQWVAGNSFLIAAAGIGGAVAAGAIRLAQNIAGICHVIFLGIENVAPVQAAQRLFQSGEAAMWAYLRQLSLRAGAPLLLGLVLLATSARLLLEIIIGPEYAAYHYVLVGYSVLYLLVFAAIPMRIALRTLRRTRPVFWAYVASSLFSVLAAAPLMHQWALWGMLAGLLIAQLIQLTIFMIALRRKPPALPTSSGALADAAA